MDECKEEQEQESDSEPVEMACLCLHASEAEYRLTASQRRRIWDESISIRYAYSLSNMNGWDRIETHICILPLGPPNPLLLRFSQRPKPPTKRRLGLLEPS